MAKRGSSDTRPPTPKAAQRARSAAAAARGDAERTTPHPSGRYVVIVVVVGLLLMAGAAFWAARGGEDPGAAPPVADLAAVSGQGAAVAPPWPAPTEVPARAAKAGLPLGGMGTADHYHVHLDVIVNGEPVPVPANIGVDSSSGAMSYLHTHTPDGIVHIEAGSQGQQFTLGQLLTQWDVRLSASQLGALRADDQKQLTAHVNGKRVPGNPALLVLHPRQQIALVYGSADEPVEVPSSYDFAPGE